MTIVYGVIVHSVAKLELSEKSLICTHADNVFNLVYLPILCGLCFLASARLGLASNFTSRIRLCSIVWALNTKIYSTFGVSRPCFKAGVDGRWRQSCNSAYWFMVLYIVRENQCILKIYIQLVNERTMTMLHILW